MTSEMLLCMDVVTRLVKELPQRHICLLSYHIILHIANDYKCKPNTLLILQMWSGYILCDCDNKTIADYKCKQNVLLIDSVQIFLPNFI